MELEATDSTSPVDVEIFTPFLYAVKAAFVNATAAMRMC